MRSFAIHSHANISLEPLESSTKSVGMQRHTTATNFNNLDQQVIVTTSFDVSFESLEKNNVHLLSDVNWNEKDRYHHHAQVHRLNIPRRND